MDDGSRIGIQRVKGVSGKVPLPGEALKMYLSAASQAVSALVMVERKEKQTPI
jgi:hypothetical protein